MPRNAPARRLMAGDPIIAAAFFALISSELTCVFSFHVPSIQHSMISAKFSSSIGVNTPSDVSKGAPSFLRNSALGSGLHLRQSALTTVHGWFPFKLGSNDEESAVQQPRPYDSEAEASSWEGAREGITIEDVEGCGVVEAADYADILVAYMESCSRNRLRIPANAAEVLSALLSHPAGAQGFWTSFLTDPDLVSSTKPSYDPALVECIARFPELNLGVISSCLSMSATEEAMYEDDEMLRSNAATSKERAFRLIQTITKQPSAKTGLHGLNWMLDLIDYVEMEEAMNMVEQRKAGK